MTLAYVLPLYNCGHKIHRRSWIHGHYLSKLNHVYISSEDLRADDWQKYNPNILVKLNDQDIAEISKNEIIIGCTKFPISKLDELVNAAKKLNG